MVEFPPLEPGTEAGLAGDEAGVLGGVDPGTGDPLSAEEAAMRPVDGPPGVNYDPGPGHLDDEEAR